MIDHLSIGVADLGKAREFYDTVLKTLGYVRLFNVNIPDAGDVACGYGEKDGQPRFWIGVPDRLDAKANMTGGTHVCFEAKSRKDVDAFHATALKAGGTDNGKPGLRPHYHENYYGGFAFDPDDNKIEACCHHPEP
jgi:catechol 2,3-dioxygenase-like lactoylglutathione lyase family enzyme